MKCTFLLSITSFMFVSCSNLNFKIHNVETVLFDYQNNDSKTINIAETNDTSFVNLADYSKNFVYDMRYATKNNFLQNQMYDCGQCYLRFRTIKKLIAANEIFLKKGYKIKLYDCYRPLDVQKKMWKVVSNPTYVADPSKGSIHNRGGAVDITLVDTTGKELDMGTDFDFFGKEASHQYLNFSDTIIKNRVLLKTVMIQNNFKIFESEWWHYNLNDANKDPLSNFKWECK